ncbi:MAG TPA: glycosyltransferase, partial [Pirellulales bacterium]|nr:glycosyltransferase [Pirellulales bacterium]
IIIVTHNALAYTQQLLPNLRFFTDEPYELIFVDNGSTDGTQQHLRSCPDVKLIENAENRGFPAAANQGYQASRGEYVLFMNNDVLVTTGWLTRMLRAINHSSGIRKNSGGNEQGAYAPRSPADSPQLKVGLVGPCSNFVSGAQQVMPGYDDLTHLDGWAWEFGKQFDRHVELVDRLIGFCLLVRREVLDQVGAFDERFGLGNYEDDDLCRRAIAAGWQCAIARDAYVHHFGHASFAAAGTDLQGLVERNRKLYEEKWGGNVIGHSSLVTGIAGAPQMTNDQGQRTLSNPQSISACLIVRDNERTIRACITILKPWVDDIVVLDTGSTDRTAEICLELGCRVYHMTWPDSFAAARNESLKYALGAWIFVMDSDDEIDEANGRLMRELVQNAPPELMAYVGRVFCPGSGPDGHLDVTSVTQVKLFRNRPDLRYELRIHEQILPSIRRAGGAIAFSELFVVHSGADRTPEGYRRKLRRDLRLLKMELAERPGCPFTLFNLGMTYSDAKKYRRGVSWLRHCIAASDPGDSHLRKAYALLASSLFQLGRHDETAEAIRKGREQYPQDTELLFREGLLFQEQGRYRQAARSYQAALSTQEPPHFSSLEIGLNGFKTRFNLARVYGLMGNLDAEEAEWRKVVAEAPTWRDGWRALLDHLLGRAGGVSPLFGRAEQV